MKPLHTFKGPLWLHVAIEKKYRNKKLYNHSKTFLFIPNRQEEKNLKIKQPITFKLYLSAQSCNTDKQPSETQGRSYLN